MQLPVLMFVPDAAVMNASWWGAEALRSCIEQCNIRTVVTSKAFLEQIKLDVPVETILLEDVAKSIGLGGKLTAALAAVLRWRQCCRKCRPIRGSCCQRRG